METPSGDTDATLATAARRRLRADILAGRITPGAKLKVQELADRLGTGPTPLREALSGLAAEGLVERIDQRGFRAAPVSEAEFSVLLRTRCWVEEIALREAIAAGDSAWEEAIVLARWRLSRLPRMTNGPDGRASANDEWEAAHDAFHRALLAACPSPPLLDFCDALRDRAGRYRAIANVTSGRDVGPEHELIADAVLARRVEEAQRLLVRHYETTAGFLRRALQGLPAGDRAASS